MNIKEEMQMQIAQLNMWTKAYDEGHPLVSDKQWDEAYFKLVQLEENTGIRFSNSPSQKIIYEVKNKLNKVEHNHPMLSLAKTKDIQEVEAFIKGKNYIAMEKLDGLTCSLRYVNHKLVSAETRGNGLIGEDILHNMVSIVPKVISYEEELIIDGEIICDTETFEYNFSKDYKNPRNYAAGAIRRLDANENKESGLSFVAWDVIKGFNDCKLLSEKLDRLEQYGFVVVDYSESENVEHDINVIKHSAKTYAYPIDGVVFKYNNIEYYKSLGSTDHHFRGGLAFKFYDEEYETTLIDIEWTMGRTGQITPIALFEKVYIDGTEVSRASLSNISIMEKTLGKNPFKGQKIYVSKRNMIIPKVERAKDENDQWI